MHSNVLRNIWIIFKIVILMTLVFFTVIVLAAVLAWKEAVS